MKKKMRGAPKAHEHDPAARAHGIPDLARTAPGHTDLMVTPESIDAFLEANPPPAPVIPDPANLVVRLAMATQSSCTCKRGMHALTITDEVSEHNEFCAFRLMRESAIALRALINFGADRRFRKEP